MRLLNPSLTVGALIGAPTVREGFPARAQYYAVGALDPLPYADSARLVKIREDHSTRGYPRLEPCPANYRDWKRLSHSFAGPAAWWNLAANLAKLSERNGVSVRHTLKRLGKRTEWHGSIS